MGHHSRLFFDEVEVFLRLVLAFKSFAYLGFVACVNGLRPLGDRGDRGGTGSHQSSEVLLFLFEEFVTPRGS